MMKFSLASLLVLSATFASAFVAPTAFRRSSSPALFMADVPADSFGAGGETTNDSSSASTTTVFNANTAAFGVTANFLDKLSDFEQSFQTLLASDSLSIADLTAQLSDWEQSMQTLLASEPNAISESLSQHLPPHLETMQKMLVAQKETLASQASELSSAAVAQLESVMSSLLQLMETVEVVIQTEVAIWKRHGASMQTTATDDWVALQTSFASAKDALVGFKQEALQAL